MMTYGRTVYIGEQHPFKQIQSIFDGECYIYVGNKKKYPILSLFFFIGWMKIDRKEKGERGRYRK